MKNRQEHIDFDRNYCTHYAPKPGAALNVDFCAVGCGSSAMFKKAREIEPNGPRMAPCIGGHDCADVHAICPKWERRSLEHAEARADSIERHRKQMTLVFPVVKEWRAKLPFGKREIIECPACKGKLHLSQSSYNGHVHGKCETPDCVAWME
jgi:hypothetical protein